MGGVIIGASRTAIGKFGGGLSSLRAVELGAAAMRGRSRRNRRSSQPPSTR